MSLRNLLLLSCLIPASSWAVGAPLETPANPNVPLGPVEPGAPPAAPPLELDLPAPPENPGPGVFGVGAPDPLPIPEAPPGIPELVGEVMLPPEAGRVLDLAPPFGGTPSGGEGRGQFAVPVPEPGTAALLLLGLGGIAVSRRR